MLILVIWQWPPSRANRSGQGALSRCDPCRLLQFPTVYVPWGGKVQFPAEIVVGCCSFPLWRAQDDTSGMEWSGRIVILSSLSGVLDKSCVLESTRKGQMFSVVKKSKQVSVCLETGCISAAVSAGGAGRALIGSLGNRHWDLVGGRPAAGIAPLLSVPHPLTLLDKLLQQRTD